MKYHVRISDKKVGTTDFFRTDDIKDYEDILNDAYYDILLIELLAASDHTVIKSRKPIK